MESKQEEEEERKRTWRKEEKNEEEEEDKKKHKKQRKLKQTSEGEEEAKRKEKKETAEEKMEDINDKTARMKEEEKRRKDKEKEVTEKEERLKKERFKESKERDDGEKRKLEIEERMEVKKEHEENETRRMATRIKHTDINKHQSQREKDTEQENQVHQTQTQSTPLSKRQMKKQVKRARWLETKHERRKIKRQREKEKAKERKLWQAQQTPENRSQLCLASEDINKSLCTNNQPSRDTTQTAIATEGKVYLRKETPLNSVPQHQTPEGHNQPNPASPSPVSLPKSSHESKQGEWSEDRGSQSLITVLSVTQTPEFSPRSSPALHQTQDKECSLSIPQALMLSSTLPGQLALPGVPPAAGSMGWSSRRALKKHSVRMSGSACKLRVAVDLSLEALMDDRRLGQCLRQVARCYSANRRVPAPLQLYVTSFQGRSKEVMERQLGYESWDVHFCNHDYLEEFEHSDIVYLTSESPNTLEELDLAKVYVIGGLVDYNTYKGHCLRLAANNGLSTARLPIDKYLHMATRKVLTIDQVFRVLLGVAGGGSWSQVLLEVLPPRKGAKGKGQEMEDEEGKEKNCCSSNV